MKVGLLEEIATEALILKEHPIFGGRDLKMAKKILSELVDERSIEVLIGILQRIIAPGTNVISADGVHTGSFQNVDTNTKSLFTIRILSIAKIEISTLRTFKNCWDSKTISKKEGIL
ncbi:hypothetical protein RF11_00218 [Thelohanellus kitauei]|uniref:Elongation factor Tu-type domain-containing protein n=1 Tax=Thelohanellus kitauei TaxID=669202 RepID=A0A0C2N158_THEKT|nr:hypothetical protein RF11_00218 [Thelohanellus kitauei]